MQKPNSTLGLRHLALQVVKLEQCVDFYTKLLGMHIEWQPDLDNVYLTTGIDNLALHRAGPDFKRDFNQALDHMGFILGSPSEVDQWFEYLRAHQVPIVKEPKTHRDGARSFYCSDPDGNIVQLIYHPPLALVGNKNKHNDSDLSS